jgi:hypothetical protein
MLILTIFFKDEIDEEEILQNENSSSDAKISDNVWRKINDFV